MRADLIIGTRPEAIKMAPLIIELRRRAGYSVRVIATGQHTDMLLQALAPFEIPTDLDLNIMRDRQTLDHITSSVLLKTGEAFDADRPDIVLVHGDTTTTFASALSAFYRKIPVAHVEAGLRSFDMARPFPEELNRTAVDRMASIWFAPTALSRENLLREGARPDDVYVTGNTVVDAMKMIISSSREPADPALRAAAAKGRFIVLTAHRRESHGEKLEQICSAALRISEDHGVALIVPMHKNPIVRDVIERYFAGRDDIFLCEPLDYQDFIWAMEHCTLIMSDSGGVQEEATALSKPFLILRDVTERPEAVEHGCGVLVGTDASRIYDEASRLITDRDHYKSLQDKSKASPFGDGNASVVIADVLDRYFAV